jgi:uncharacterized ParB-like nuclease family protein
MTAQRILISQIQPWRCAHPPAAAKYTSLLKSGHTIPPIEVIKQKGRFRYRIFDGMHRTRAMKICGRRTVRACVIVDETGAAP